MPEKILDNKSRTYSVLSVDDSLLIRQLVKISLKSNENHKINLIEAGDGQDAYLLIKEACPDLLITDYNMPGMNGLELISKIRNEESLKPIPIILLTAENDEKMITKLCQDFNVLFLRKPFTKNRLNDVVSNIIRVFYR
ncbi:MAG: response regulator [Desulfobacula sp.]|jgi:two-component system chemotaxis response regulator CheY